jgi:phosphoribosyl 1,2-cyclic phosphate phosphodiesterase
MIVTFLGTSAANAFPEAFCGCDNCERARMLGGPSLRKRSALLINDDLLIDLGPDILTSAFTHGRPLTRVQHCLQTHAHADHLDPSHLFSRSPEYGVVGAPRLHVYASAASLLRAAQALSRDCRPAGLLDAETGDRLNLEIHQVEAGQSFMAGGYRITAFAANHDPSVEPLLYAVEGDDRSLFYGVDTATLPEETWHAFHRHRLSFDLVILDHTYGPDEQGSDHLCARDVIEHVARFREEGLLRDAARVFATHIAHEGNPAHPELAAFAARHGYEIAYDGLVL